MTNTKTINKRLTAKQQIFVNEIAKGKTQREACILAYPKARNWNINTVDVRATALMKNEAVKEALQNLNKEEKKEVLCTKEKITKTIVDLIDSAEAEQDRIIESHEKQLQIKQQRIENLEKQWLLAETDKEHLQIEYKLLKAKEDIFKYEKENIVKADLMNTIFKGTNILIKMYGWKDLGWENFSTEEETEKKLTAEELKEIINNTKKQKEAKQKNKNI